MSKTKQIFHTKDFRKFAGEHTAKETAEKFGLNIQTFYLYARETGLVFKKERKTPQASDREILEYAAGHTLAETARHFGICPSSVKSRCLKAGVVPYRERSLLSTREFWAENKDTPVDEIAEKYGFSPVAVYTARRKFKDELQIKDRRRTGRTSGDVKEMMAYLSKKFTLTSIGKAFGCSHEYVRQVVNKIEKEESRDQL